MTAAGRLDGRVAIVTGGASGIGAASARAFADAGAHVLVADVAGDAAAVVAAEVGGTAVTLDVSDPAAWERVVADATRGHGGIDVAHLNAGIVTTNEPRASFLDVTPERYRTVVGVNLDGVVLGVRALAPSIEARGGGAIVATASVAGLEPWGADPVYSATKHAVVGFVRSVAPQLARRGVRVHAICPGGVATPLVDALHVDRTAALRDMMLPPEDVAAAVLALVDRTDHGVVQTIVHGRGAQDHEFRGVPGPRADA